MMQKSLRQISCFKITRKYNIERLLLIEENTYSGACAVGTIQGSAENNNRMGKSNFRLALGE